MNENLVLGLAVIGGISAIYSFAVVVPLILGAIAGAIGCGIIGVIIGLIFLADATDTAVLVVLGCVLLGLVGGLVGALEKMLVVSADEYVEIEDVFEIQWKQLSTICSGITLLIAGIIGASIAGTNTQADALTHFAGYGAGSLVGSVGWFVAGKKMVHQLMLTWYMHKLENVKKKLEKEAKNERRLAGSRQHNMLAESDKFKR